MWVDMLNPGHQPQALDLFSEPTAGGSALWVPCRFIDPEGKNIVSRFGGAKPLGPSDRIATCAESSIIQGNRSRSNRILGRVSCYVEARRGRIELETL